MAGAEVITGHSRERFAGHFRATNDYRVEPDDEWREILHEEVARLSDKYRLPLLLCDLEGKTHAQAATELNCGEATIRRRLTGARGLLRSRLIRRGVAPAATIVATALSRSALAKVPPGWAAATVAAAARMNARAARIAVGEIVSTTATTLARKSLHAMLWTQVRTAAASVVFLIALVGKGWGVAAYWQEKIAVPQAPAMQNPQSRPEAPKAPGITDKPADTQESFTYQGRVLDPDGKPFAGAKLVFPHFQYREISNPHIRATSDAEGRFGFTVAKGDFEADYPEPWNSAQVAAIADGFGPGWANSFNEKAEIWGRAFGERAEKADPRNLTIRLARDNAPVSGRIVDLQGRPLAGAVIRPRLILAPADGDLSGFIAASKSGRDDSSETERAYLIRSLSSKGCKPFTTIVTDADGRFSLAGVGPERVVELTISGPTVQTKEIRVLTREIEPFQVTRGRRSPDWGISLYFGANFTYAAAPTKPVVGIVKDKDTGKPLPGVRIASNATADFPVHGFNGIETTTGQDGRYRLVGLPKGRGNHVIAIPAKGQPYLAAGVSIPDTEGLDPVVLDVGLKRGILIEGRVTDAQTGEPAAAFVAYNSFRDYLYLREAPGFDQAYLWGECKTERDGSYRVVALPGHGLVSAVYVGSGQQYLTGIGLNGDLKEPLGTMREQMPGNANALAEIDPPKGASTLRRDLALERGLARTIRVVDPSGIPVARARIQGLSWLADWSPPQESPEFRVTGLRRGEKRRLHAILEDRKLAGWVEILAEAEGAVDLKLQPWATAVGRLVDDDREPRANVAVVLDIDHWRPYTTDASGRFRIEGLIPGMPQDIWVSPMNGVLDGKCVRGLVLAAGEVKDLGDVREKK